MGNSQKRAIQNYRSRLSERGLARFEVLGLESDRDLIRSLARRLADDGPDAARIRATVNQTISGEPPKTGGILAALPAQLGLGSFSPLLDEHGNNVKEALPSRPVLVQGLTAVPGAGLRTATVRPQSW